MILTFHHMRAWCDNPKCCAKSNLVARGDKWLRSDEARGINSGQARMQLIRAGWKIRKDLDKALCPECVSSGLRMANLNPRWKKNAKEITGTTGPEAGTDSAVSANVGSDQTGVSK